MRFLITIILVFGLAFIFLPELNQTYGTGHGNGPQPVQNPFGIVSPPQGISRTGQEGLVSLLNTVFKVLIAAAGIYAVFNIIIAGYQFISAGGNPESVEKAWNRIWQTMVGLLIVAGAFVIAGVIGFLIYGPDKWDIILNPKFGP